MTVERNGPIRGRWEDVVLFNASVELELSDTALGDWAAREISRKLPIIPDNTGKLRGERVRRTIYKRAERLNPKRI